jgi:hypothetical protein
VRGFRVRVIHQAYKYPSKSTIWKNSMAVTQTPADPPNAGRMDFVIIGWIEKSKVELQPMVM